MFPERKETRNACSWWKSRDWLPWSREILLGNRGHGWVGSKTHLELQSEGSCQVKKGKCKKWTGEDSKGHLARCANGIHSPRNAWSRTFPIQSLQFSFTNHFYFSGSHKTLSVVFQHWDPFLVLEHIFPLTSQVIFSSQSVLVGGQKVASYPSSLFPHLHCIHHPVRPGQLTHFLPLIYFSKGFMCSQHTAMFKNAVVYSPFGHQAFILSSCLSIICPPQPCTRHPRCGFDAGLCCNAQRRNKSHWGWWITAVFRIPPLQALFQCRALEGCLHFPLGPTTIIMSSSNTTKPTQAALFVSLWQNPFISGTERSHPCCLWGLVHTGFPKPCVKVAMRSTGWCKPVLCQCFNSALSRKSRISELVL